MDTVNPDTSISKDESEDDSKGKRLLEKVQRPSSTMAVLDVNEEHHVDNDVCNDTEMEIVRTSSDVTTKDTNTILAQVPKLTEIIDTSKNDESNITHAAKKIRSPSPEYYVKGGGYDSPVVGKQLFCEVLANHGRTRVNWQELMTMCPGNEVDPKIISPPAEQITCSENLNKDDARVWCLPPDLAVDAVNGVSSEDILEKYTGYWFPPLFDLPIKEECLILVDYGMVKMGHSFKLNLEPMDDVETIRMKLALDVIHSLYRIFILTPPSPIPFPSETLIRHGDIELSKGQFSTLCPSKEVHVEILHVIAMKMVYCQKTEGENKDLVFDPQVFSIDALGGMVVSSVVKAAAWMIEWVDMEYEFHPNIGDELGLGLL
ncbi:hypothetical protein RJT34_16153 [Clitoria ternatea]|uniref:Uncharacterized protein n=1 Tax=Clitoria ternatea TaxID=43366 RepID=A0AAN9J6N9_CLITE